MQTRLVAVAMAVALIAAVPWLVTVVSPSSSIRLGLVHSRTGPLASTEAALIDAELLAVAEINQSGGLLGRFVDPVIADGASSAVACARAAEELIRDEKVCVLIGGWSAASRRAMKAVVERNDHLLIHPAPHEGLEASEHVIYVGAAPNQRIVPAASWGLAHAGKRFFLLGADEIGSHTVNAVVRDQLKALGGEAVGEAYVQEGSANVAGAVAEIVRARPDLVFSSIAGDSHRAFYTALRAAEGPRIAVLTVGSGEQELKDVKPADRAGDFVAASYLQAARRPENQAFIARLRDRLGADRVVSDAVQTAYVSVHLWAQAVTEAGTDAVTAVRKKITGQCYDAPEGVIAIDPETRHAWRSFSIGRFRADGSLEPVWSSHKPVRPLPYPASRSRVEWEAFLLDRFTLWGGAWSNPVHAKW